MTSPAPAPFFKDVLMRNEMLIFLALLVSAVVTSCRSSGELRSGLDPRRFEAEVEGKRVALYVLKNRNGMEVSLCNYGARVVSIVVPDRRGRPTEVTLGFDNLDGYRFVNANFGATIGRYANRIAGAELPLGNRVYPLAANSGPHCLHGGRRGWQTRVFDVGEVTDSTIRFAYFSSDGEEGFPGNVRIWVDYSLTADRALRIDYTAVTDRQTVVNPTNHTFFNLLSGKMDTLATQIARAHGYDHTWVLNTRGCPDSPAATLYAPGTGIGLEVFTDAPGIQIFTANAFNGSFEGRRGISYRNRPAVCLETQHFPDSPHHPDWPSTLLMPGDTLRSRCTYRFFVREIAGPARLWARQPSRCSIRRRNGLG